MVLFSPQKTKPPEKLHAWVWERVLQHNDNGKEETKEESPLKAVSQSETIAPRRNKIFHSQIREVLLLSICAVLVFLIYSNTLGVPFILDDAQNIEHNQHIRLTILSAEGIVRAGFKSPSSYRPVANISFALNYYFHQYDVEGYHVVNILIHMATGLLLYLFIKTT